MKKLRLALDWTPNINHIGFFVAQKRGFYKEVGLAVQIIDPREDNYVLTPAKKVEVGQADFALCPTESIISYRTKRVPFDMIAIAAVLQEDLSAIVVKRGSGINSPKDLDGKLYSSYRARYEDGIVKAMIVNDGGTGDLYIDYPTKLGIWNTLLNEGCDATWIFENWEGIAANNSGADLNYFYLRDYAIPYSYSPVIATSASALRSDLEAYTAFLKASKQGYLYCQSQPDDAISILSAFVPEYDRHIDLNKALAITLPHFGNAQTWGQMNPQLLTDFMDWIVDRGLEKQSLNIDALMTSVCFERLA